MNYMDRSVSIVDMSALLTSGKRIANITATVKTIRTEKLAPQVLRGKQLFYDAADVRLARDGYLSCAVCHDGGENDGRTWDLTGFGEGLRNTISLIGHGGLAEGFLHWSANFDEIQDFEGQIRGLAGGSGLMSDSDFNSNNRSAPLGGPKAGLSPDLDALAAYVSSLTKVPVSPFRTNGGVLTNKATVGKSVFVSAGCGVCHAGTHMTISGNATQLKDIGTINTASGKRLGGVLNGIDTPSLRGVWSSAPYLHNGSAPDLETAIQAHSGVALTPRQLNQVAEYLREVEQTP
jgi:cytochrome c peroxidase